MEFLSRVKKLFKPKTESSSATPSAIPYATMKEQFRQLKLTKACKDRVQGMRRHPSRLRINLNQSEYLALKLELVVEKAEMFLKHLQGSPTSEQEMTNCLKEFKLLHKVACAVENFIDNCCKDAWVTAAILMPNMAQDVLSLVFELILLESFFTVHYMIKAEDLYRDEASVMTKKAANDGRILLDNVKALLRTKEKTSVEYKRADFLMKRLETPGVYRTEKESLTEERRLGSGSSATVHISKWLGIDVARKTFSGIRSPDFQAEMSIVKSLSHPNLGSMYCYTEGARARECSIVMELMDNDLSQVIEDIMKDESRKYPFNIDEAVDIMLQVGKGVEYLHEKKIIHRDLKAANILVKQVGNSRHGESKSLLVKVVDFGLSKVKETSRTYSTQTSNNGTTRWMAPEVIRIKRNEGQDEASSDTKVMNYPFQSDVHSFGMVCYEILTGRLPYEEVEGLSEVKSKILSGVRPKLPQHCFARLKDLIERCWSQDASKRPRFVEICAELRNFRFHLLMFDFQQRIGPQVAIKLHGEAQIVVGLDIGTEFSGYAFAHRSNPEEILTFSDWPESTMPYCKTPTAVYYEPGDAMTTKVKSWGWEAVRAHQQDFGRKRRLRAKSAVDLPKFGTFSWNSEDGLQLHEEFPSGAWRFEGSFPLPMDLPSSLIDFMIGYEKSQSAKINLELGNMRGTMVKKNVMVTKWFNVPQVIADFLREIGASIMRHLRTKFGGDITMADVQWCVTVWSGSAKKQMQVCMARAGLVRSATWPDGSPHPVSIMLEREAASCYCHRNMPDVELKVGDRLLVADIGAATTDIVVQELISDSPDNYRVTVTNVAGGKYLDYLFFQKCWYTMFPALLKSLALFMWDSCMKSEMYKQWEEIKFSFGVPVTIGTSFKFQLPSKVAAQWKEYDKNRPRRPPSSYDELELTHAHIEHIFAAFVKEILDNIAKRISRTDNVKVISVVGGFGGSPYLLTKMKERFLGSVEKVMSPVQPETAVCKGAVMLALKPAGYI